MREKFCAVEQIFDCRHTSFARCTSESDINCNTSCRPVSCEIAESTFLFFVPCRSRVVKGVMGLILSDRRRRGADTCCDARSINN